MKFMEYAYLLAKKAYDLNEVPVGAVVVKDNEIIGKGYNLIETKKCSIMHAEIIAIKEAQKKLSDWRLNGCFLFVTLEPCLMCVGACLNSRIDEVVFSLKEDKTGAIISKYKINIKYKIDFEYQEKVKNLMQNFFKKLRNDKKN